MERRKVETKYKIMKIGENARVIMLTLELDYTSQKVF
jgi:hypothetical protein